ncbi:MAG: hypothetical protein WC774_00190 [Candidatus Gracilibacteria bacterium]
MSDDGNIPLLAKELGLNIQQRIFDLFVHLNAQIPVENQRNFIYKMPGALEICVSDTHLIYLRIMQEKEDVFVSVIGMPRDESGCACFPV